VTRSGSRRRRPLLALAFLLLSGGVVAGIGLRARAPVPGTPESQASASSTLRTADPAKAKRLAWFHEAKYGLFIHWGLYAIPAGEWKGRRIPGIGEWIMHRTPIPVKEYEQLAGQFNPIKFNADEWVQLAKDAGMKYLVTRGAIARTITTGSHRRPSSSS
jgi:alpha-L-fucosidase